MKLDPKYHPERCISTDDDRWNLSAPYLDKERGKIVATEGHMMVVIPATVEEGDVAQHLTDVDLRHARGEVAEEEPDRNRGAFPRWHEAVPAFKPYDPETLTFGLSARFLLDIAQAIGAHDEQVVLTVHRAGVNDGMPILVTERPRLGPEDAYGALMAVRIAPPHVEASPPGEMPSAVAALKSEDEGPREALYGAVRYLLDRIQTDGDLGYAAGFGTEAHRLLCLAEAAHLGEAYAEVETKRRKTSWRNEPRVLELQAELEKLRG
jgi:hypothetical protein